MKNKYIQTNLSFTEMLVLIKQNTSLVANMEGWTDDDFVYYDDVYDLFIWHINFIEYYVLEDNWKEMYRFVNNILNSNTWRVFYTEIDYDQEEIMLDYLGEIFKDIDNEDFNLLESIQKEAKKSKEIVYNVVTRELCYKTKLDNIDYNDRGREMR